MLNRKGQNIAEYSILIALVIAAAVAMQTYVKRGLQGRVRDAVDYTGNNTTAGFSFTGNQYEPYYASSASNQTQKHVAVVNEAANGQINTTLTTDSTSVNATETATAPSNDTN
jgi:hypothetical protein